MRPKLTIKDRKPPVCLSELGLGELFIYAEGPLCVYRTEGPARGRGLQQVRRLADNRPYELLDELAVYRVRITRMTVEILP